MEIYKNTDGYGISREINGNSKKYRVMRTFRESEHKSLKLHDDCW